jgi:acetyl esterase/lipase
MASPATRETTLMSHSSNGLIVTRGGLGARAAHLFAWFVLLWTSGLLLAEDLGRRGVPEGVDVYRDIVYRKIDGREARLDIYVPSKLASEGARPTLIAVHGGSWIGGSKNGYGRKTSEFCRHGYVVVSVSYVLARPRFPSWPSNLEDVREAVRWVRRHHEQYGIDPGRIAVIGASAGGHLASLLGTLNDEFDVDRSSGASATLASSHGTSAHVSAVIDFYGPTDLKTLVRGRQAVAGPVELLLGGSTDEVPDRYTLASPITHVSPGDAPHLIIHGSRDVLVPISQSERLAAACKSAGVRHQFLIVDGAGHGFELKAAGRDLIPKILAFLDQTWENARHTP